MHIGFLTPEYPHELTLPSAGIGSSLFTLANGLAAKGHRISVFVYGQKNDSIITENNTKIHILRQRKFRILTWYFHRKFLQDYINKSVEADKIDAVEAADWTGITAFISIKCPLIVRMHGTDAYFCFLENRKQKKKNFWFEKKALKSADYLISVSKYTAAKTVNIFKLKRDVVVIPNAVDIEFFRPGEGEKTGPTILYFGSLVRKKGVMELVHVFNLVVQEMPEVKLILIGRDTIDVLTGTSTKDLIIKAASKKALKNIIFKGLLSYDNIKEEIDGATLVVLPSFAEAFPMTWLEAMAMEKALITSNIGWAEELMIDGETGFTVHPKNHLLFKDRILKLLQQASMRQKLGKAARMRIESYFSTEKIIDKNISFYRKVISRKK